MWIKAAAISIGAFMSTALGVRVAQAKTQTRLDAMEESFNKNLESIEKSFEKQLVSMGREIGELKADIKSIHDDIYRPRFSGK